MEQQERIRLLLSLQEHPENYTDEQITQMMADDPELATLMEQLATTKRAFVHREANKEDIPMDDLWEQFASEHEEEFDALDSQQEKEAFNHPIHATLLGKILGMANRQSRVAAAFLGIIFTAGFAFAAIHIVRHYAGRDFPSPTQEMQVSDSQQPALSADTIKSDTAKNDTPIKEETVVYDNVSLDSIAKDISDHHHIGMDVQNGKARQLRFYFVWRRDDSLQEVVEKLNMFEQVSLSVENGKLIVK